MSHPFLPGCLSLSLPVPPFLLLALPFQKGDSFWASSEPLQSRGLSLLCLAYFPAELPVGPSPTQHRHDQSSLLIGPPGRGGGWPLAPEVGSPPPPSSDQSGGSSASGVRLQGAGEEMNSVFCNLDRPRPDCLLSRALPVVGSPLGRTGSFTGGSGDNRGSSVALRHLGPNKRMAPRRRMGARLHSLNGSHAAGGDGTKHTVMPHSYTHTARQSACTNRAVYMGSDIHGCTTRRALAWHTHSRSRGTRTTNVQPTTPLTISLNILSSHRQGHPRPHVISVTVCWVPSLPAQVNAGNGVTCSDWPRPEQHGLT